MDERPRARMMRAIIGILGWWKLVTDAAVDALGKMHAQISPKLPVIRGRPRWFRMTEWVCVCISQTPPQPYRPVFFARRRFAYNNETARVRGKCHSLAVGDITDHRRALSLYEMGI